MICIIVKGSKEAVERECQMRGIPARNFGDVGKGEAAAHADNEYHAVVVLWFCEPSSAPFPDGTLLYYSVGREPCSF